MHLKRHEKYETKRTDGDTLHKGAPDESATALSRLASRVVCEARTKGVVLRLLAFLRLLPPLVVLQPRPHQGPSQGESFPWAYHLALFQGCRDKTRQAACRQETLKRFAEIDRLSNCLA
jgi:hypothetical protein